jgi:hypothetical protein
MRGCFCLLANLRGDRAALAAGRRSLVGMGGVQSQQDRDVWRAREPRP